MDYVYKMTWAEFRIRSFAYNRETKRNDTNELLRTREICYQIYVSNWMNPKRKPMSKDKYWSLEEKKVDDAKMDRIRQRIKEAQEQYKKDKLNG